MWKGHLYQKRSRDPFPNFQCWNITPKTWKKRHYTNKTLAGSTRLYITQEPKGWLVCFLFLNMIAFTSQHWKIKYTTCIQLKNPRAAHNVGSGMSWIDPKGHTCHRREACLPAECSRRRWLGLLPDCLPGGHTLPASLFSCHVWTTLGRAGVSVQKQTTTVPTKWSSWPTPRETAFTVLTGILPYYLTFDSDNSSQQHL